MRTERRRKSCRSAPAILLSAVAMLGAPIASVLRSRPTRLAASTDLLSEPRAMVAIDFPADADHMLVVG
jgi:hypothetical protein